MKTQKEQNEAVQKVLDAAMKLITEYYAEVRLTRYPADEKNMDALMEALKPFERKGA